MAASTNDITFREAKLEDTPQIQQCIQSAFRAEDSRPDWTGDMELPRSFTIGVDDIAPKINTPESTYLVFTDAKGAFVGTVLVSKKSADQSRVGWLAVSPAVHRGGIGRKILAAAEEYSQKRWGTKTSGLNALNTRKALIAWYERCGYVKTGETSPFYRKFTGNSGDDELCFVELEKQLG